MTEEEQQQYEELSLYAKTAYERGFEDGHDDAVAIIHDWLKENAYKYVKGSLSASNYCTEHLISDFKHNFK